MKVVIDARMIGWTGIGRYTKRLLEELESIDAQNQYIVLIRRADWDKWEPKQPNFSKVEANFEPYSPSEQLKLPGFIRRLNPDLVHFLSFNAPMFYSGPRITTLHDLTLVNYSVQRGGNALKYEIKRQITKLVIRVGLKRSRHVITDTHFTREQLIAGWYAPPQKITAIHLGAPKAVAAKTKSSAKPYLLYVGNLYPFKNLSTAIESLPYLHKDFPELSLIVVGEKDVFASDLEKSARRLGVADLVKFTGFVTDAELNAYYSEAAAYVFPSLAEGFGLPPLEAMAHGVPVAASQASCLPEVLGKAAEYFDPNDPRDLARAVNAILSSAARRKELVELGHERLKAFRWTETASQTLEIYKNALAKKV